MDRMERVYNMTFASVYPLYISKVERNGRTKEDVDEVTRWLTGFSQSEIDAHVASGTRFRDFFADASLNPNASLITGVVCGVKVQEITDPLMQQRRERAKQDMERMRNMSPEEVQVRTRLA